MFSRNTKKRTRFSDFLSGDYTRDYIYQDIPYTGQIDRAAKLLSEADYVLLGAGAGMSTAAGAEYGGRFFEENFAEFQKIYGKGPYMQDMYSAGFYPFPDQESKWGYWAHQALLAGIDLDVTPLHKTLLDALTGKKLFLLSTNADHQFEKAGLPTEKIFQTQGSYRLIQCRRGCHPKTYNAEALFRQMERERVDGRISWRTRTGMTPRSASDVSSRSAKTRKPSCWNWAWASTLQPSSASHLKSWYVSTRTLP